jgi:hypothetical protein
MGFLFLAAPHYASASWHLGHVYTGTSYRAVKTMVEYPRLCRQYPTPPLTDAEDATEATRIDGYAKRSMGLAYKNLAEPVRVTGEALKNLALYAYTSPARIVGTQGLNLKDGFNGDFARRMLLPPAFLLACLIATATGIWMVWARAGYAAFLPLGYATAYLVPNIVFSYYLERFGAPISWLGWLYFAYALPILFTPQRRLSRLARLARKRVAMPDWKRFARGCAQGIAARRSLWAASAAGLVIWIALAATALVWFDTRPLPVWNPTQLLASPKTLDVLAKAGITPDPELAEDILAALANHGKGGRVQIASAFLPIVNRPENAQEPTTSFSIASPWKIAGEYADGNTRIPGTPPQDFVNGDLCVVISDEKAQRGQARAIIPIRWATEVRTR